MRIFFAAASIGLAALLTAATLASPVGAQGQGGGPKFGKGYLPLEGNTQYDLNVGEDKKSALIIFNGLGTTLAGPGAPLFASRVFSISIPLTGAEKGVKVGVLLEGSAVHQNGIDMSLITTVNGQAHVMDFAKSSTPSLPGEVTTEGECDKVGWTQEKRDAIKRKLGAKYPDRPRKPNIASEVDLAYHLCMLLDVPSASALRLNVIFALHRHNPEPQGYVTVDSIAADILSEAKRPK